MTISVRYCGTLVLVDEVTDRPGSRRGIGRGEDLRAFVVPAAPDEGLGQTFLERPAVLVDEATMPGDYPAPAARSWLECVDPRDDLDRVSERDRLKKLPFQNGE